MTDKQIDEQEAEIDELRTRIEELEELSRYYVLRIAFYEKHTNKQANELVALTLQKRKLLQALQLAESVYRMNAVGDGEPSSVLDCLQAAISEAQP